MENIDPFADAWSDHRSPSIPTTIDQLAEPERESQVESSLLSESLHRLDLEPVPTLLPSAAPVFSSIQNEVVSTFTPSSLSLPPMPPPVDPFAMKPLPALQPEFAPLKTESPSHVSSGIQPTRPVALMDDLGPLGESFDARTTQPVAPPAPSTLPHEMKLSEVLEQVQKDQGSYEIHVQVRDPIKVNEVVNPYMAYKTNAPYFRSVDNFVYRRYRDFLYLSTKLTATYPAIVIPPVPEKNALGRFQEDFVETRRMALERCIKKIVSHPVLQQDEHVVAFLQSDTFPLEKEASSRGFMSVLGSAVGITSSATNEPPPVPPKSDLIRDNSPMTALDDIDIEKRKTQMDAFENELKSLTRAIEALSKHRRELAGALSELGEAFKVLSTVPLSSRLVEKAAALGQLQLNLQQLTDTQTRVDFGGLMSCVEEWSRMAGSLRSCLTHHSQVKTTWESANNQLNKKKELLEKLTSAKVARHDKIVLTNQEIQEATTLAQQAYDEYASVTLSLKDELRRFDNTKTSDFYHALDQFVRGMLTRQNLVGSRSDIDILDY